MKSKSFSLELAGKTLIAEFSDLTNQTNGSVLLKYGETAILVTVVMSDRESGANYFRYLLSLKKNFMPPVRFWVVDSCDVKADQVTKLSSRHVLLTEPYDHSLTKTLVAKFKWS